MILRSKIVISMTRHVFLHFGIRIHRLFETSIRGWERNWGAMESVDNLELAQWREMDSIHVLRLFANHIKEHPSLLPRPSDLTTRWLILPP